MHIVSTLDTDEYRRFLERFGTAGYQQIPQWCAARGITLFAVLRPDHVSSTTARRAGSAALPDIARE